MKKCSNQTRNRLLSAVALLILAPASNCFAKPILQTLEDDGNYTSLLQALKKSGLDQKLQGPGPFTLFAPTDKAFAALPDDKKMLMEPGHEKMLGMALGYHLIAGPIKTSQLEKATAEGGKAAVTSVIGMPIALGEKGGTFMANDAHIIQPDIGADNGVIQSVDAVLLPPTPIQPQ